MGKLNLALKVPQKHTQWVSKEKQVILQQDLAFVFCVIH